MPLGIKWLELARNGRWRREWGGLVRKISEGWKVRRESEGRRGKNKDGRDGSGRERRLVAVDKVRKRKKW